MKNIKISLLFNQYILLVPIFTMVTPFRFMGRDDWNLKTQSEKKKTQNVKIKIN